jgi:hypothetical protein
MEAAPPAGAAEDEEAELRAIMAELEAEDKAKRARPASEEAAGGDRAALKRPLAQQVALGSFGASPPQAAVAVPETEVSLPEIEVPLPAGGGNDEEAELRAIMAELKAEDKAKKPGLTGEEAAGGRKGLARPKLARPKPKRDRGGAAAASGGGGARYEEEWSKAHGRPFWRKLAAGGTVILRCHWLSLVVIS